ncbi:L-galactose dehydrogenase isoform X1 [Lingula anatina]|uniref:L-galactose dehydrogenase isoform X1 n=1 Tax=Lingula anatina TaxID=7574 RepID=A0A1S3IMI2_LINAN|nr:L-galactose dehydrogenase isoform X1 [Lingula anatina]XP_013399107.1 L-galactose dehydrogenase isoform X1 [Lingula anatina]|eukprot:XP_013399106.1 L-galactose dehydrogenase isoform X1 [Lingula anatina]
MSLPVTYVEGFHDVDLVKKMQYVQLGKTDMHVSRLSLGTSAFGSVFRQTDDKESHEVLKVALKSGINYLDCAPWYGHGKAETVLGQALKSIPRQAYYVATKVGRYLPEATKMFDFSAERTMRSVDESLQRLGLEYIDVIQVHDMEFAPSLDVIINETLPALQKCKDMGKVRHIGITGYPLENFRTVLERSTVKIDTILTYCRCAMNDTSLREYYPYLKERGVGILNGSPIGMGLLTHRGPADWHPATQEIREKCAEAARYCQEQNVDISKLAMQFALEQPEPHSTMFSTASLVNLQKNLEVYWNGVTDGERKVMEEVMERFMNTISCNHWEGVEEKLYWKAIQDAKNLGKDTLPNLG